MLKDFGDALRRNIVEEDSQVYVSWVDEEDKRNKPIDSRYHVCWGSIGSGKMRLEYCRTMKMMSDTLTKPSGPPRIKSVKDLIPLMLSLDEAMYWRINISSEQGDKGSTLRHLR